MTDTLDLMIQRLLAYAGLFYFYVCGRGVVRKWESIEQCLEKGFILAPNHVSYFDWIILWAVFYHKKNIKILFLGKEKLFTHILWGAVMRGAHVVKVSDTGDKFINRSHYKRLLNSKYVAIFPEGTRSKTGEIGEFKNGIITLSKRLNLPIIPVGLLNFEDAWHPQKKYPKLLPKKMEIRFGIPIKIDELNSQNLDIVKSGVKDLLCS